MMQGGIDQNRARSGEIIVKDLLLNGLSAAGRSLRRTPLARSDFLNRVHTSISLWLHSSNEATMGPFCVRFDPRDRMRGKKLALYGEYDVHEISLLCSLLKPGDHVLDIGANIGLYSLYFSRAVGESGRVIAFEPDPDNLALLKLNLERNECKNVEIVPCALNDQKAKGELFQDQTNRGHLSLFELEKTEGSITVSVRRGDEVMKELGVQPRVAKIDVEGAEPGVIAGLGKYKPEIMLFEFWPGTLLELGHMPDEFLASLVADGYMLAVLDPATGEPLAKTPQEIVAFAKERTSASNILARRSAQSAL